MKNTSELYFSGYESTSCTPSSASVSSGTSLVGVLMQKGRVISYTMRQLRRHEGHYPTHDLELATIVMTLRTWCHYLHGNVVHIYMDQKSLNYIFTKLNLNIR
jgi:hypothetical protein